MAPIHDTISFGVVNFVLASCWLASRISAMSDWFTFIDTFLKMLLLPCDDNLDAWVLHNP
jgi:hypothetical protein